MAKIDTGSRPRRGHLQAMLEVPWAILPSTLRQIVDAARSGITIQGGPLDHGTQAGSATRMGAVSVIPVHGAIEHRSDWISEMLGTGTSVESLREALRSELADPAVKAIVLDVDSPGGSVAGITELAAEIRAARGGTKPIVAVANTMAASAAYWLAASCDEMVATPSAQVGAIGIYAVHEDVSRMLDGMGVTVSVISAGPHKTEGNEFEPLSDEARADIQKRVDASYDQFISDVAAGRRVSVDTVRADYGGGRVLTAKDALKAGMVDRIGTLNATVQRLGRSSQVSRRMAATGLGPDLEATAIAAHKTATDNGTWDGGANEANCPAEEGPLRASHAWVEDGADPNLKGSYKFIHHEVSADGSVGAANMTGCSSGIGYLNRAPGATGRPNIPDGDRKGVWNHLTAHLRDGNEPGYEPPPLSGEATIADRLTALTAEATSLVEAVDRRARVRAADHQPAISTVTERALRATRDAIDALLDPGDPEPPTRAGAPPVVPAPQTAAILPRFRSREEWLRHLETR